jgi:hypothetical protein
MSRSATQLGLHVDLDRLLPATGDVWATLWLGSLSGRDADLGVRDLGIPV